MSLDVIKKINNNDLGKLGTAIVFSNKFGTTQKLEGTFQALAYSGIIDRTNDKLHDDHIPGDNLLNGIGISANSGITEVIPAQGTKDFIYVTSLSITNSTAVDYEVQIKDGMTTKMYIPAPAGAGAVSNLHTHLRLSQNTALNFAHASGVKVTALGYRLDY